MSSVLLSGRVDCAMLSILSYFISFFRPEVDDACLKPLQENHAHTRFSPERHSVTSYLYIFYKIIWPYNTRTQWKDIVSVLPLLSFNRHLTHFLTMRSTVRESTALNGRGPHMKVHKWGVLNIQLHFKNISIFKRPDCCTSS